MEVSKNLGYIYIYKLTLYTTLILLAERIQVEFSILKTWVCTRMPFVKRSDKAHGKKGNLSQFLT